MTAEFLIADTGIGIAAEDLERIFEPFERGRLPAVAAVPGTGLGLTISRLLVRILGGDLTVESKPGQGSVFKMRLMLPEAPRKASRRQAGGQTIAGYAGKRRTVVMADDDPLSLDLMREVLSPLGFAVHAASEGKACLALVEKYRPDLVILDINMPGMTGWEVATAIRDAGHREMAILMVSAEFLQPPSLKGREPVHDDYLVKPIEIPLLLERIQTLLDIEWTVQAQEVIQ